MKSRTLAARRSRAISGASVYCSRLDRYEFTVTPEEQGERLDAWLARRGLPWSRSQLTRRIEEGEVTVGGSEVRTPSRKVRAGERVVLVAAPPVAVEDRPEDIPLVVLYEDSDLIVIDKPAGMVVHPATSHQAGTLVNALLHHCGESLAGVGGERRPGIVHRLDKDTSGVMIVAKNEPTLVALQVQFHAHDIERMYLALVEGVVAERGSFKTSYGRDPRDRKKFSSEVASGKRAVTHWRVRERLPGASYVEVSLETGRTHQIRVHFSDHDHALIGDRTYGRPPREARLRAVAKALGRQALHAHVLGITHPGTRKKMRWSTEPPADMQAALAALRAP
ncbi:MAG TPA: RluA family pseudouridine synthase [Polyangia bacterium]|nr:RluA family pseudouridine synthase [Polyangia bacterium]